MLRSSGSAMLPCSDHEFLLYPHYLTSTSARTIRSSMLSSTGMLSHGEQARCRGARGLCPRMWILGHRAELATLLL